MPSREALISEECGAIFSTRDSMRHRKAEIEDKKFRNTGFVDG